MLGKIKSFFIAIGITLIAIGILILGPILIAIGSVAGILVLIYFVVEDERKSNQKNKDVGD